MALVEELSRRKAARESVQSQIRLYQHMQAHLRSPRGFLTSPLIHCTRHPNLRQELDQQYSQLQEKLDSHTLDAYLASLERQQEEDQLECFRLTERFWQLRHRMPNQLLSATTIRHAIDQRLSTITNRFTCIEKYKKRFIQMPQP